MPSPTASATRDVVPTPSPVLETAPWRRYWSKARAHAEAVAVIASTSGLLVQCAGYAAGWGNHESLAVALWYVGFLLIVAPFVWHLLLPARSGRQRLTAAVAFGLLMYASYVLSSPVVLRRFDENLHVTTLVNLVEQQQFFFPNDMLAVSPYYPGLELATAGLHWLTGLPLTLCMILVVGLCRVLLVAALFLIASRLGRSTRVGEAATLLYVSSAQYYFYNAQFAYQSMAIALVVAALYLLVRAFDAPKGRAWKELVLVQVCLAALAVTHHLTSWLMLVLLWVLAFAFGPANDARRYRLTLLTAQIATIAMVAWSAAVAPLLINYLGPIFETAGQQILTVLEGQGGRSVGTASDGTRAPVWQVMLMAASVLMWTLLLLPAGYRAWRGASLGRSRARYVPLAIALAYPVLQVLRLAPNAGEVGDRASTFVFLAMALVVGAWLAPRIEVIGRRVLMPGLLVLILGGTLVGSGPDWRLTTGPFLPGAQQRSIDGHSMGVAQWAGTYLPAGSRVAADINLIRLLPNVAPVVLVLPSSGDESMTPVFMSEEIDEEVLSLLLKNEVDFVFVDTRQVGKRAKLGSYYEDTGFFADASFVTPEQVSKFENVEGFELVLDGPVRVYDVRGLGGRASAFADRAPPGVPGTWRPWQVGFTVLLLLVVGVLRGSLFDPRRFRAADLWRLAVLLPALMLAGVGAVVSHFSPAVGAVVAGLLVYGFVQLTRRPPRLKARSPVSVSWGLAIALTVAAAIVIATWSSWNALLDHEPIPAPRGADQAEVLP